MQRRDVSDEMVTTSERTARAAAVVGVEPSTRRECDVLCGSLLTIQGHKVLKIGPKAAHSASKGAFCCIGSISQQAIG
ncbi:hypothetical protein [Bradyrhizobium sp.]|uniref:hypothetical protein n=1 Tax=Bradyrhizobium sp. TaxID=376 RepID=UPI003D113AF0